MASELSEEVVKKKLKHDPDWADWNRTGDKVTDQLHFYLTGLHYDCTFRASVVSNEEPCAKTFRCHKLILATVSKVFEKMLFGGFKEANQSRDDEIKVEVSPIAFDFSMRFIYGNQSDFQSCELAVEIYYFAHKWMIESLLRAAEEFLVKQQGPNDVLLVYEMCIDLNIDPETELRKGCRKIIQDKTVQVLSSKHWLAAGKETLLHFYLKTRLTVSEAYLLEKLVLWGKARCSSDQSTNLRAKIEPMLKHIRFRSMSFPEFSAFSKKFVVLTTKEKMKIMESISLSDANLMPLEFSPLGHPRNLIGAQMFSWDKVGKRSVVMGESWPSTNEANFCSFYVDKGGVFLGGIYVHSLNAERQKKYISYTCTVIKTDTFSKLGTAKFDEVRNESDKQQCLLFNEPIALTRGILHHILIKYNSSQAGESFSSFMYGGTKFYDCPGYCKIFFHPCTNVVDICGFKLFKR